MTGTIHVCRDLFNLIQKIELDYKEKNSPTIPICLDCIDAHIKECSVCKELFSSVVKKYSNQLWKGLTSLWQI